MIACQATLSMGFSRQEYWSGLPFPSPGYIPKLGIKLESPALQVDSLPAELPGFPYSLFLFCFLIFSFVLCLVIFVCSVSGYFCVFCVWLFFIEC